MIPSTVSAAVVDALAGVAPGARVAVGLSGGVDSSVAALLLRRAGYDVVGLTMQVWDGSVALPDEGRSGCFGPGEVRDIEAVRDFARRLDIPHVSVPLADEYRREVIDYVRDEYLRGRTPNPCARCNRVLKLGLLLDRAREMGIAFDAFATGHYARRRWDAERGRHALLIAADRSKDQTYFLARLDQPRLARLVLPLGGLRKTEVRAIADDSGFADIAAREESQDFIESRDYSAIFREDESKPGPIETRDGQVLGAHRGLIHYTIGQRKGLGIGGAGDPWYVVELDAGRNRVIVGRRADLERRCLRASNLNWIGRDGSPVERLRIECRIRQNHSPASAALTVSENEARVDFDEPQLSVTPGQIAVFYRGEETIGSGVIEPAPADAPSPPS